MLTRSFWQDALERGLKSFAQAVILALGADHVLNVFHADLVELGGIGLGGFLLSILTSMASSALPFGNAGTASLTKAVEVTPAAPPTT